MRVKLLRGDDEASVLLVHPATLEEYVWSLDTLGRAERRPADGCGVVTTAEQRSRWELPDLSASGRARVVDSAQAFALLAGPAEPETAWEPSAGPAAGAAPPPRGGGGSGASALAAVRALAAPGTQVDQALATLDDAGLPAAVRQTLRRQVREALDSRSEAVSEALGRAGKALALPWRTSEPQGFDPRRLQRALDYSHGALTQVKARIRDVLAACPQTRALLTVERPRRGPAAAAGAPPALAVRPGPPEAPASVLCLAGPKGTGKSSLAEAVARALGRTHVRATLEGGNAERLVRGSEGGAAGRIVEGLCEAGVNNPVFILEAVDRVEPDAAGALLYLLDPARRTAFRDAYLDVAFDLSAVLWIVTATDSGAIPEPVREHLAVVELPACTEEEKLAIAQQHLLTRPFDTPAPAAEAWLPPGLPAPPGSIEPAAAPDGPAVVAEREVASARELEAIAAQPPPPDIVEAWRTAACDGEVRFETEAIVQVIRDHTCEAGVAELNRKLAAVGRHVVRHRPPDSRGPDIVTPANVREVLGDGDGDALPPAVRTAIESERRRLAKSSDGDAAASNAWIDWLEQLPWNRRSDAPTDLAQARAALDAGHAGLDQAKTRIVEHLAVRRRNPRGPGAVICFSGPPGVGKTSLAQCVASALGRGFAKLSCGGLRDETDLRGHNRTWKGAQPGSILRELRRIGRKNPVFVLDELDKLGPDPAAVLLEVLDPAQHARFRDAFVELPFDLSEILFITTANDPDRIRPALRDRLEIIDLPGYAETEKLAIARTHLIDAQKRAAGLEAAPLRLTDGAYRRIIRDYTSEQGVRQLARCLQAICRKVALGLETGDAALVRDRITAAQVRTFLGEPDAAHSDGLVRLRQRLDAAALPRPVRVRGRRVLAQLSACAPTDPEHHRAREYLDRLLSVPWTARARCAARPGARARGPRRRARRPRSGQATSARPARRAPVEPRRRVPGDLSQRPARGGQVGAGAARRRGAAPPLRLAVLRRAGVGRGARRPLRRARTHRRGVAARRRPQPGLRPRRGGPARRSRRRRGAARGTRPGPRRPLPRPLSRLPARPVRGALHSDGDHSRRRAGDAARTVDGGGVARLHRCGEAGHRDPTPVATATGAPRVDGRAGPRHRRGGRGPHRRLHPRGRRVGPGRGARRVVRQSGPPARRERRRPGRGHAADPRRTARRAGRAGCRGHRSSRRAAGHRPPGCAAWRSAAAR